MSAIRQREYFKLIPAVHLFLVQDGGILLLRRHNTGYEDGSYSVPAGHVEAGETVTQAMIREAKEEAGITIAPRDLKMIHVTHRHADQERVDFFFTATAWHGQPTIMEPEKCDDLRWFPVNDLPSNTIPYVRAAIELHRKNAPFSEFGWPENEVAA